MLGAHMCTLTCVRFHDRLLRPFCMVSKQASLTTHLVGLGLRALQS